MLKPASLRGLLLASVPNLAAAPERLAMFVDKGRIASRRTGNLAFEYRYSLNVVIEDYAGDMDGIFVPLLAWVEANEPSLMDVASQEPFAFETEILDADRVDVSITIDLTERVLLEAGAGGLVARHLPEPVIADRFPGVDRVPLMELLHGETVILPDPEG